MLADLALDTAHFTGSGGSRGKTALTSVSVARGVRARSLPDDNVFVARSLITGSGSKPRLLRLGWPYRCTLCEISAWQGNDLKLHIDHINGKHYDNRLKNLRFRARTATPKRRRTATDGARCYRSATASVAERSTRQA